MMTRYDPTPALAALKGFQRATVDHVADRFYRDGVRRFLVADETGLGKSLIARGVIARTAEHLQDDDRVGRVDVVYVCSNADIARQNLARLRIGEGRAISVASRLTLLVKHSRELVNPGNVAGKPVNIVAFTPGTSFDTGWRTGKAEERALLYLLMSEQLGFTGWDRRAAKVALLGGMSTLDKFQWWVDRLQRDLVDGFDPVITDGFATLCAEAGLDSNFRELVDEVGRRSDLPAHLRPAMRKVTGELRAALARAGIGALEPDLIILDEFQRFRNLLSVEEGGPGAELAHALFDYQQARVLLLSATPYKPFTLAEESDDGENHHRDFLELLRFLNTDAEWHSDVEARLRDYRSAMIAGRPAAEAAGGVRELLLGVMCRTERPRLGQDKMLAEHVSNTTASASDLLGYAGLRALATELAAPATIEYWKSAPYFVNFMDGYVLGGALREALRTDAGRQRLRPAIAAAQRLDRDEIRRFARIPAGNGRLRALMAAAVDSGQARLLWLPPSLPYQRLAAPFTDVDASAITKRLVFSSWNATPTAVAALLSYEVERQLLSGVIENSPDGRRKLSSRLEYRLDSGRPSAMTTLALFWPHPELAARLDPLALAREHPRDLLTADQVQNQGIRRTFDLRLSLARPDHRGEASPAHAYFQAHGALPGGPGMDTAQLVSALAGAVDDESDVRAGLTRHVTAVLDLLRSTATAAKSAEDLTDMVGLGLHGPGNIAWRALGRLLEAGGKVTPAGHWTAAAILASGLRALFNRPESIALLDHLYPDQPYWQKVLSYCSAGGLQATMDEYLYHLRDNEASFTLDDNALSGIAATARDAIALRPSVYQAFDPNHPDDPIRFTGRFALRYGAQHHQQDALRPGDVRNAFNSPFWPFVVTTTSAGQEGIDFHWWSHAVVHWNTPANPVDFEQREGRVHRYGGHAIRKNIAALHRADILSADDQNPWQAAFRIAADSAHELGEFAPFWLYPGPAKIERHLMPYVLSRDVARIARLKDALAMYRLAFGQPRQEDFIDLLTRKGTSINQQAIDLRPSPSGLE